MHELSIAESIIDLVADAIHGQSNVRVVAVHIRLGPLSGVVSGALQTAFKQAATAAGFGSAGLVIEETSVTLRCALCDEQQPAVSPQELRCKICGTPSNQIIRGREMELATIEVVDNIDESDQGSTD